MWSNSTKSVIIIELTVPAEENIPEAVLRKTERYRGLTQSIASGTWDVHFFTIEIGV